MANDLANKIKNYRIDNNLTLDELAHKSGVSRATLARIENGQANPTMKTIRAVEQVAFRCDNEYPTIKFTVEGKPGSKGRPRFTSRGGHARTYTPKATTNYEAFVKFCAMNAIENNPEGWRRDGAYEVYIGAYFAIPKSRPKAYKGQALIGNIRPTTRPDVDNITKIICDALNGIAWMDDSQVVICYTEKIYAEEERVVVLIKDVTHPKDRWTRRS